MKIENKTYSYERALYGEADLELFNCRFEGQEDGESALKEANNINITSGYFDLRYPLWHVDKTKITGSEMTQNCRAPLWYSNDININYTNINGVKALRECKKIIINNTTINSDEVFWRCDDINITDTTINGFYAFFQSNKIKLNNLTFNGKYSFQYVNNLEIENATLNTKDAFWHASNVTVKNSTIIGEYLGWYSNNLKLINCKIIGTQPLCYCDNLEIIDCTFEKADFAFENSHVNAKIIGNMISIKHPLSGEIRLNDCEIIIDNKNKRKAEAKIIRTKEDK